MSESGYGDPGADPAAEWRRHVNESRRSYRSVHHAMILWGLAGILREDGAGQIADLIEKVGDESMMDGLDLDRDGRG